MNQSKQWEQGLAEADSVQALAPDGYDDEAALARVRALHERMSLAFPEYPVKTASPALYQDSTGLTHCRVSAENSEVALAWVVLSHFGELVTVQDCRDAELLARIRALLEDLGLDYIDYGYVMNRPYHGKCKSLVGLSWANRYFALAVEFNTGS